MDFTQNINATKILEQNTLFILLIKKIIYYN